VAFCFGTQEGSRLLFVAAPVRVCSCQLQCWRATAFAGYASNARPLIGSNEPAIYDKAVRGKNRRQVGWRIQPSQACEEGNIVVNYLPECGRRVIVKVGRSSAYSTQFVMSITPRCPAFALIYAGSV